MRNTNGNMRGFRVRTAGDCAHRRCVNMSEALYCGWVWWCRLSAFAPQPTQRSRHVHQTQQRNNM